MKVDKTKIGADLRKSVQREHAAESSRADGYPKLQMPSDQQDNGTSEKKTSEENAQEQSRAMRGTLHSTQTDGEVNIDRMRSDHRAGHITAVANFQSAEHTHEVKLMSRSIFARIAKSGLFQNFTLFVIFLNAVWILIDVEYNHVHLKGPDGKLPLQPGSDVIENIFCSFFTIEILIRFLAFQKCTNACRDAWFLFDQTLVGFMILETWLAPILELLIPTLSNQTSFSEFSAFRLLRLLRLTRLARIMRFFPELITLVRGMIRAMQSVIFILMFLLIVTYIFAIVFTNQFAVPNYQPPADAEDPTVQELFADMGSAMMSLFTYGVLGDNLYFFFSTIREESLIFFWLGFFFLLASGITLLNMLIGVLCQVIGDSSQEETEERVLREMKECLERAFKAADLDENGVIQESEWENMLENPVTLNALRQLGADDDDELKSRLIELKPKIFKKNKPITEGKDGDDEEDTPTTLDFPDFVDQVMDFRSDVPASVLDVELIKIFMRREDKRLNKLFGKIEPMLTKITGHTVQRRSSKSPNKAASEPLAHNSLPGMIDDNAEAKAETGKYGFLKEVPTELLYYILKTRASSW
eukprot:TRINITY_DN109662_c0_g1_i1.p1 TRINITY_DN109662_c0_g1~~TRINITY_DN109662_c0_g1_i1.p1  ORF type:complete len:585 (+),score=126.15 TRINITY_DN109662_c0_g1_i1:90-1844(+)